MAASFTRPYVDALLAVAGSPGAAGALLSDLDAFARALETSPELREVFRNPSVERARKAELLGAITAKGAMAPLAVRFLSVLLANRRIAHLSEVIAAVRERLDRDRNVVEARVQAARPLADAEADEIRKALEGRTRRTVRLRTETDPGLLGGFVVRIGSEVYDASLSTRLARVRAAIHEGTGN